jgi:hypothetical protein
MKKRSLVLATLCVFLSAAVFSQGFHLGIKGGTNIFKIDGKTFKEEFQFGYSLGGFAEINFSDKWGIQPEVLWNQTNFRTGDELGDVSPFKAGVKGKLNYLSIPLLLSFTPSKFLSLQAGPQFGILLNDDKSVYQNGEDAFRRGDFSLLAGAQLNLGSFRLGGRYVAGMYNINDVDDKEKWKNQGFQLYLGLRLL